MEIIFINGARFIFIALMFFCVLISYRTFLSEHTQRKKRLIFLQAVCIYMIHLAGYIILFMELRNIEIIVMYGLELFFMLIYMYAYHVLYPNSSKTFLNNICMFMVLGFIMITRFSVEKGQRQFLFVFAGGIATLIIPFCMRKIRGLRKIPWFYGIVGIVGLLMVYLLGETEYGANLAISIAGFSLQPAEFIKIVFVFFVASMLNHATTWKTIIITSVMAGLHVILLVMSTDLGAALIYFCVYVIMLYSATRNPLFAGLGIGAGGVASYIAYNLFRHVRTRVEVWKDPWSYIDDSGYQITQSLFSIGMGSWFGTGLFLGMPEKIPFVEKDFMFSAIVEELGVVFGICLILLCLNTALLMIKAGMNLKEPFYRLLAAGFASVYGIQVFLTIGGGMNMIPITGVTLPLVSYGGSSAVSTLMMFAVVQGLNLIDEVEPGETKGTKKAKSSAKTRKNADKT